MLGNSTPSWRTTPAAEIFPVGRLATRRSEDRNGTGAAKKDSGEEAGKCTKIKGISSAPVAQLDRASAF